MSKAVLVRSSSCKIGGINRHSPMWVFEGVRYSVPPEVIIKGEKAAASRRFRQVPNGRRIDLVTGKVEAV